MQFARQPACRVISLFNYIPLAERGQIAGHVTVSVNTMFGLGRLPSRPPARFSSDVSTHDLRLIAQVTSVHQWLLAITPTAHSVRRPSTPSSRSCFSKQLRHKHPVFSPAFNTGIGPCGNSAHQQSPSGLQFMGASQRAHRVSITLFSLVTPILSIPAPALNFQLISSPG